MPEEQIGFDEERYRDYIQQYCARIPLYEELAQVLKTVLQRPAKALGSSTIVQSRVKGLASFAEKIQRSDKSYTDPVRELTDLCGARVITHTLSGASSVCSFIEEHFEVFLEDSGDKLELLGTDRFGYLSKHYVVAFREGVFPETVVSKQLINVNVKAEVQVRTLLQHTWADIAHEYSYKSQFKMPFIWERELARLAAVLEEADQSFDRMRDALQQYAANYLAYNSRKQLEEEIKKARSVLEIDPGNERVAHEIAKMAMSLDDWGLAIEVLLPFSIDGSSSILCDLGVSLCKQYGKKPGGVDFRRGQDYLEQAVEKNPDNVDAIASLGGTWRKRECTAAGDEREKYRQKARDCYRRAYQEDPGDPYALGNYIEYEIAEHPDIDILPYFRPSLNKAIERCSSQAEVGVNIPWAYFDLGKFHLFLQKPSKGLTYYAKGVESSTAKFFIESALSSFAQLEPAQSRLPGLEWSREFLELASSIRFPGDQQRPRPRAVHDLFVEGPVVIVAGDCSATAESSYRELLIEVFRGFEGNIISGGTRSGIAGVVGELQSTYSKDLQTIGYMPSQLPEGILPDERYCRHHKSQGNDFSPLEPLCYWADLQAAGITPDSIKLIVLGGGAISTIECCLAAALGVSVAIVRDGGKPAALLNDPIWSLSSFLKGLPADMGALREFLYK